MSKANEPVFVVQDVSKTQCIGITKREYFAALAMQGALANPERLGNTREIAEASVTWADALLNELSKENK